MSHKPLKRRSFRAKFGPAMFDIIRNQLYTRKIEAPIREYLTNAADIHIRVGKPVNQVKVTLPTRLHPCWTARDYGTGMSFSDIQLRYVIYFATDKEEREDETGSMGLGCKSAFAYTTDFTVISYHQGTRYVYKGYLDETLMGKMDLIMATPTKEPDGMEISIPVQPCDIRDFEQNTVQVLRAFTDPPAILGEAERIEPLDLSRGYAFLENWSSDLAVVMNNVSYAWSLKRLPQLKDIWARYLEQQSNSLVIAAKPGEVDFIPSREQLEMSDKTIKFLLARIPDIIKDLEASFQAKVEQCQTFSELVQLLREPWVESVSSAGVSAKWKGRTVKAQKVSNYDDIARVILNVYSDILSGVSLQSGMSLVSRGWGNLPDKVSVFVGTYPITQMEERINALSEKPLNPVYIAIRGKSRKETLMLQPEMDFGDFDALCPPLVQAAAYRPATNTGTYYTLDHIEDGQFDTIDAEDWDPAQPTLLATKSFLRLLSPKHKLSARVQETKRALHSLRELIRVIKGVERNEIRLQGVTLVEAKKLPSRYGLEEIQAELRAKIPNLSIEDLVRTRCSSTERTLEIFHQVMAPEEIALLPDSRFKQSLMGIHKAETEVPDELKPFVKDDMFLYLLDSRRDYGSRHSYTSSLHPPKHIFPLYPNYPSCGTKECEVLRDYVRRAFDLHIKRQA